MKSQTPHLPQYQDDLSWVPLPPHTQMQTQRHSHTNRYTKTQTIYTDTQMAYIQLHKNRHTDGLHTSIHSYSDPRIHTTYIGTH